MPLAVRQRRPRGAGPVHVDHAQAGAQHVVGGLVGQGAQGRGQRADRVEDVVDELSGVQGGTLGSRLGLGGLLDPELGGGLGGREHGSEAAQHVELLLGVQTTDAVDDVADNFLAHAFSCLQRV